MCYGQPLLHVLDQTYVDLCAKCLEGAQCCKLQAENGSLWASGVAAHVVWHVKVQFSFIKNVQTLNNFAIPSSSVCGLCIHQRLMPKSLERQWRGSVVLTEVTAGILLRLHLLCSLVQKCQRHVPYFIISWFMHYLRIRVGGRVILIVLSSTQLRK